MVNKSKMNHIKSHSSHALSPIKAPNHSEIADQCRLNHSIIVDDHFKRENRQYWTSYAIHQTYLPGGLKSWIFADLDLRKICHDHKWNDYRVSKHNHIKSVLIVHGLDIHVFTPISNNNMISHTKIIMSKGSLWIDQKS